MLPKPIKPSPLLNAFMGIFAGAPIRAAKPEHRRVRDVDSTMATRLPLRILLVDDNATNRKLGAKVLERLGYRIDVAVDGRAAIASYTGGQHDVILMDIEMPDMDGIEATRLIRASDFDEGSQPFIVALTANAMAGDRERYLDAGMDDYVSKPLRVEELVASLREGCVDAQPKAGRHRNIVRFRGGGPLMTIAREALHKLFDVIGENPDLLAELIESFLEEAPLLLDQMQRAADSSDRVVLGRAAHTLKSSARDFGADAAFRPMRNAGKSMPGKAA